MDIHSILNVAFIAVSVLLVIFILLQQQGSGLGTIFGGSGGGESYRSKRGIEKFFFNITIVLIVLFIFIGLSIAVASAS
jgi:protein translocase SecG subunit